MVMIMVIIMVIVMGYELQGMVLSYVYGYWLYMDIVMVRAVNTYV